MKTLLYFFISLNSFLVLAQSKDVALKIYLEDAYTGKNIKDAKVTLEGYEIQEIVGTFDKKGKFYYFTEIPKGYNTIMAYHKDYNEKGFQKLINSFPKELKFRLQDVRYVSYQFEKPTLKNINKDYRRTNNYLKGLQKKLAEEKEIHSNNFKYLYQEDPYHIAIISKYPYKDFISNKAVAGLLNSLSLEYTHSRNSDKGDFEYLYGFNQSNFFIKYRQSEQDVESISSKYYVHFLHKKDRSKFKRYNCKEIKELRASGFEVAAITNRIYEYYADGKFDNKSYDLFYKHHFNILAYLEYPENYEFGKIKIPQQIFFGNSTEENEMYFGKEKHRTLEGSLNADNTIETLYLAMPKQEYSTIGLGVLDIEDKNKSIDSIYFFNSLNGIYLNEKK